MECMSPRSDQSSQTVSYFFCRRLHFPARRGSPASALSLFQLRRAATIQSAVKKQIPVTCVSLGLPLALLSGVLFDCSSVARGDIITIPKPAQPLPAPEFDSLRM